MLLKSQLWKRESIPSLASVQYNMNAALVGRVFETPSTSSRASAKQQQQAETKESENFHVRCRSQVM